MTNCYDEGRLRGVNGYNLNMRGSEIVGEELARWILAERVKPAGVERVEPAAEQRAA